MSNFLDYKVDAILQKPDIKEDDLNFLELSGRQSYWSQGYYGQDITVAVIDTGVAPHEVFGDRLLKGRNFNSLYSTPLNSKDDNGHGTHCAGSVAGGYVEGMKYPVGIAPQAKILPVKVLDGTGDCKRMSDIVDGINYAISQNVDIITMSLSATKLDWGSAFPKLESAIKNAVSKYIIVLASMGNTSREEIRYPSGFEETTSVGAVDKDKKLALFSTTGNHCDVCQIGVNVISSWFEGGYVAMSVHQ